MPTPAKISQPQLYDVFHRERLFQKIEEQSNHPALWIQGPPGSGKTTLAGQFIKDSPYHCIWYQIDNRDNDASLFFNYMQRAFSRTFSIDILDP